MALVTNTHVVVIILILCCTQIVSPLNSNTDYEQQSLNMIPEEGNKETEKSHDLLQMEENQCSLFPSKESTEEETFWSMICTGSNSSALEHNHSLDHKISEIILNHCNISFLDLNEFRKYPILQSLSVTACRVEHIWGSLPPRLKVLNISHNEIKIIPIEAFRVEKSLGTGPKEAEREWSVGSGLELLDISYNRIGELPKSFFNLQFVKALWLKGNPVKCEFVWEKLWEWSNWQNALIDANDTHCGVTDDVRVFHYDVRGVLNARTDLEKACSTVNKSECHDCSLYALQRDNGYHDNGSKIWISLKLDCSGVGLSELPEVPFQTWQLNISNNKIHDLSGLKRDMFSNLLILDADNNGVDPQSLLNTPFILKYNYLSLKNNSFISIPPSLLASLKVMRGQGVTFLGGNYINCDCDSVKEIKPFLIENSRRIKDLKDIFCLDEDGGISSSIRIKDVQLASVCHFENPHESAESSEYYLYIVIGCEVLLIFGIVAKVWHDQRTFRRTGILPWCSAKMPRLPCDAMLESVKEGGLNRGGSAASSNTNVHSTHHHHGRDLRSPNTLPSIPPSDRSSTQPSHSSNSSLRTSSV